ncbi:MAG TPA: hypothetical protein VK116_00390, partial [Planctomycetota bacterium]|nr:hypothetical protein [Planctomycetota bacterium]
GEALPRSITVVVLLLVAAVVVPGCRFTVGRTRSGSPLRQQEFEKLEPGTTTLQSAMDALGAPDRVKWETDQSRLTWLYLDVTHFQTRLQVPISVFGYRHNLYNYFEDHDLVHAMDLVFDEQGVLEEKSLRVPAAYRREEQERSGMRVQIAPRYEHMFLLVGDGGIVDYEDIFEPDFGVGLDLAIQPVAPVTFSLGGRYHELRGDDHVLGNGDLLQVDDMDLYTLEAALRLQIPLRIFAGAESFSRVWELFLDDDPATHDGWIYFIEGTVGFTVNEDVRVARARRFAGTIYDRGIDLSNAAMTGFEYSARHVSVRAGLVYRAWGGFDRGSAAFARDGESLQALGVFGSIAIKF